MRWRIDFHMQRAPQGCAYAVLSEVAR
jgi:hypothetical protein